MVESVEARELSMGYGRLGYFVQIELPELLSRVT